MDLNKNINFKNKLSGEEEEKIKILLNYKKILKNTLKTLINQLYDILYGMGIEIKKERLSNKKEREKIIKKVDDYSRKMIIDDLIDSIENFEESIKKAEERILTLIKMYDKGKKSN